MIYNSNKLQRHIKYYQIKNLKKIMINNLLNQKLKKILKNKNIHILMLMVKNTNMIKK